MRQSAKKSTKELAAFRGHHRKQLRAARDLLNQSIRSNLIDAGWLEITVIFVSRQQNKRKKTALIPPDPIITVEALVEIAKELLDEIYAVLRNSLDVEDLDNCLANQRIEILAIKMCEYARRELLRCKKLIKHPDYIDVQLEKTHG